MRGQTNGGMARSVQALYILTALAALVGGIWCGVRREYALMGQAALVLITLAVPRLFALAFHVYLPAPLEGLSVIFLFLTGVLGEVLMFYEKYAFWDLTLHFLSGLLFCAFGLSFTQTGRGRGGVSVFHRVFYAFCFSLAAAVIWEFFEFGCDRLFLTDMQKDTLLHSLSSGYPHAGGMLGRYTGIEEMTFTGLAAPLAGYLDIGLYDTVEDMFMGTLGALAFSVWAGFELVRGGRLIVRFIPVKRED